MHAVFETQRLRLTASCQLYRVIAQRESRLQAAIARAAKRDSEETRYMAVLGSVFLPASLVAVCMPPRLPSSSEHPSVVLTRQTDRLERTAVPVLVRTDAVRGIHRHHDAFDRCCRDSVSLQERAREVEDPLEGQGSMNVLSTQ